MHCLGEFSIGTGKTSRRSIKRLLGKRGFQIGERSALPESDFETGNHLCGVERILNLICYSERKGKKSSDVRSILRLSATV